MFLFLALVVENSLPLSSIFLRYGHGGDGGAGGNGRMVIDEGFLTSLFLAQSIQWLLIRTAIVRQLQAGYPEKVSKTSYDRSFSEGLKEQHYLPISPTCSRDSFEQILILQALTECC